MQINDINEKVVQYSVLRVLGLKKENLILILLSKGVLFGKILFKKKIIIIIVYK